MGSEIISTVRNRILLNSREQPHPKYKANFKGATTAKGYTEGSEQPRGNAQERAACTQATYTKARNTHRGANNY